MLRIFIDANGYLGLFKSVRVGPLLGSLQDLRPHIFVPRQTADEVERNTLAVASAFLNEQLDKLSFAPLPDLLSLAAKQTKVRAAVNRQVKFQQLKNEIAEAHAETLHQIANSTDPVSKKLRTMFRKAQEATEEQLLRARFRKEVGNRPGFHNDPLGDQIAWEQLLDVAKDGDEVWS